MDAGVDGVAVIAAAQILNPGIGIRKTVGDAGEGGGEIRGVGRGREEIARPGQCFGVAGDGVVAAGEVDQFGGALQDEGGAFLAGDEGEQALFDGLFSPLVAAPAQESWRRGWPIFSSILTPKAGSGLRVMEGQPAAMVLVTP